jgi:hypothetical protein
MADAPDEGRGNLEDETIRLLAEANARYSAEQDAATKRMTVASAPSALPKRAISPPHLWRRARMTLEASVAGAGAYAFYAYNHATFAATVRAHAEQFGTGTITGPGPFIVSAVYGTFIGTAMYGTNLLLSKRLREKALAEGELSRPTLSDRLAPVYLAGVAGGVGGAVGAMLGADPYIIATYLGAMGASAFALLRLYAK